MIQTVCIRIVNGTDIPNYERMSPPVLAVDSIAICSAVIIVNVEIIHFMDHGDRID